MRAPLTAALLLASAARSGIEDVIDREARRLRPPPVIPPPPPPTGPTCSDCGDVLRRIEYSTLNPEPSPRCWACIEAAPGRERMAAKRLRRLKRAGATP
jgi:hypothetical protein